MHRRRATAGAARAQGFRSWRSSLGVVHAIVGRGMRQCAGVDACAEEARHELELAPLVGHGGRARGCADRRTCGQRDRRERWGGAELHRGGVAGVV